MPWQPSTAQTRTWLTDAADRQVKTALEAAALSLSRWRLDDMFVKSGVGVSIYTPLATAA